MSSIRNLARQTGRVLSGQIRRLRVNLERLARQVREAVARTVSEAIAEATHEALQIVLQGPPALSGPWQETPGEYRRSSDGNEVEDRRDWPSQPPRTLYESLGKEYEQENNFETEEQPVPDRVPESPQPRRWARALSVACQAAAWWLRRHQGQLAGLVATGIGLAAGLVAFLGSPALASAAGTAAATALSVLALADAARAASAVATAWL